MFYHIAEPTSRAFLTLLARLISRLMSRKGSKVLLSYPQSLHFTCALKSLASETSCASLGEQTCTPHKPVSLK